MSKKYYLKMDYGNANTAASKAPGDIEYILDSLGYTSVLLRKLYPNQRLEKVHLDILRKYRIADSDWKRAVRTIQDKSKVVLQYPCQTPQIAARYIDVLQEKKECEVIAIIHDLETLRMGVYKDSYKESRSTFGDNVLLKKCKYVICHNDRMRNHLLKQGFSEKQLISLEIFDYIIQDKNKLPPRVFDRSVVIAGNMSPDKSKYIYKLYEACPNLKLRLFGPNFDSDKISNKEIYMGQTTPEELPYKLCGTFGIVWDGDSLEACVGNTGNYLRYNNPHKASLYLASGVPIIVWNQSALASFVKKHGVGVTVEHLTDIENILTCMTEEEYKQICNNLTVISEKIRTGQYFKEALEKCR
jgi:hypothetical protein